MKKNVLFYGVLVAFMFLIAINTNVLGFGDYLYPDCGEFVDCYWDWYELRDGECEIIEKDWLRCNDYDPFHYSCNAYQTWYCCEIDPECEWWFGSK